MKPDDTHNPEWNDMKASWKKADITEMLLTEKLRLGLRVRMLGSWAWLLLEVASVALLTVLVVLQFAMGQPVVGTALAVLTLLAVLAHQWARRSPLRAADGNLRDLIDATIARARRSVRFAWANYFVTAASVAYVLALFLGGVGDPAAAYHDAGRVTAALIVFALYAVGVAFYHRYARRRVRRFVALRTRLAEGADDSTG
jgi:hypothetical protein